MSNFLGKINLATLKHVIQEKKNKAGEPVKCVVIPIEQNRLFHSVEKGNIYLDFVAWESDKDFQSHSIQQSIPKEEREAMSEEERKAIPYLGSLNEMSGGGAKPQTQTADVSASDDDDDLPF
jgi:hypothetical protein